MVTIQDDRASEDSTSRLETQNTDIKARATVQQHVTRVLNNEHGTQSLHQIPKLLTYVTFKIFVFSTQKCKGKSLNGKKKKKPLQSQDSQSRLHFCSLLCCKKPSKTFLAQPLFHITHT